MSLLWPCTSCGRIVDLTFRPLPTGPVVCVRCLEPRPPSRPAEKDTPVDVSVEPGLDDDTNPTLFVKGTFK